LKRPLPPSPAASSPHFTFIDVATDRELPGLDGIAGRVADMTLTPDGKGIVTAAEDVRVWETATRKERLRFQGHTGSVYAVEISPDGRRAASTGWDRKLLVWDLGTGKILGKDELLLTNSWSGPAFSPDNKTLVVPDGGHALVFRDAATGRRLEPPVAAEA
jgi:WD40 repeat protein